MACRHSWTRALTVPAERGLTSSPTSASLCVGFTRAGFPQRQLLQFDALFPSFQLSEQEKGSLLQ